MIQTLFFSPYKILPNAQENKYLGIFFLFYHGIVCCVYSLELPHQGNSNEYTQHTIIVLKIEKISLNYRYLFPELVPWLTLSGSNYPCLKWISMVPKMFEPLRFDYIYVHVRVISLEDICIPLNTYHAMGRCSRRQIDGFFLFFPGNRIWHFMQFVLNIKSYFLWKIRKMSSAEIFTQHAKS